MERTSVSRILDRQISTRYSIRPSAWRECSLCDASLGACAHPLDASARQLPFGRSSCMGSLGAKCSILCGLLVGFMLANSEVLVVFAIRPKSLSDYACWSLVFSSRALRSRWEFLLCLQPTDQATSRWINLALFPSRGLPLSQTRLTNALSDCLPRTAGGSLGVAVSPIGFSELHANLRHSPSAEASMIPAPRAWTP